MSNGSSLSKEQREAAVALFEIGWGARAVARRLGVGTKGCVCGWPGPGRRQMPATRLGPWNVVITGIGQ